MVLAEAIDAWREALVRKVCRAVHPDGRGAAGLAMLFRQPLDLYPGIAADLLQETQYQPLIALRRRR